MKRLIVPLVVAAFGLVTAATALAAGGTALSGYSGVAGIAQAKAVGAGVGAGGTLPFTGVNLVFMAIGAVALIGSGVLLRRRSVSSR